jgi:hypothetical protein
LILPRSEQRPHTEVRLEEFRRLWAVSEWTLAQPSRLDASGPVRTRQYNVVYRITVFKNSRHLRLPPCERNLISR